jgi:hypothetical protein
VIERWPRSSVAGTPFTGLHRLPRDRGYEKGRAAWLRQVEANPDDAVILGNAASFFINNDNTKAGELLRRARDLDPGNPEWSQRIGHLYSLQEIRCDETSRRDWAAMALAEMERGLGEGETARPDFLPFVAREAFNAGDLEKARVYASQLLEDVGDTDRGDAFFHGNQVLGLICMTEGDIAGAREYLIESGKTTGSPVLISFGPDMDLAKGLLDAGERDAVLEYFQLCSKFWEHGGERLALWTEVIERGGTPERWPSRF